MYTLFKSGFPPAPNSRFQTKSQAGVGQFLTAVFTQNGSILECHFHPLSAFDLLARIPAFQSPFLPVFTD
jgi:hypothetical protein